MYRALARLLALLLLCVLTACGSEVSSPTGTPNTSAPVEATAVPTEAAPTTTTAPKPLPHFGDTVTYHDWVISLASMGWGTSLFGSGAGPIQRATGKFWVLWVDARNLQGASRSLAESFDWRLADEQGHLYREAADQDMTYGGILDSFLRRQERATLGAPVRVQALTHPLLVFDLAASGAPAELIIQDGRGADEVRFNLRTPPAVTRLREPPQAAAAPTARPVAPTVAPARPAQRSATGSSKPAPRVAPTPIPVVPSGVRTGAICRDGWRSYSTGSGTCSHHGGVDHWLYGP